MNHALVTGGAGFIGSHLVDRLLQDDWRVTILDNFDPFYDPSVKRRNIHAALRNKNCRLIVGNILEATSIRGLKVNYDAIVHLAARAGVRPSLLDPCGYQRTNVEGTQAVLELARECGVKQFVFASSSSVYGTNPHVPWTESEPRLLPISPYAASKMSGEALGHVYSHLYGIRFVGLRFFTVCGPRQRPDLAVHRFAKNIVQGKPIELFGDGSSRRDYTFVDDTVQGIRSAMAYTDSGYEIFNLGNDRCVTLCELVNTLERELGIEAQRKWLPFQAGDVHQTWADLAKARSLLSYNPTTPFELGVRRFVKWFRNGAGKLAPGVLTGVGLPEVMIESGVNAG